MLDSRISLDKLGRQIAAAPIRRAWQPVDVAELRTRLEAALASAAPVGRR